MSRRLVTQICARKRSFVLKDEAEQVIDHWRQTRRLRYPVTVYRCPFGGEHYHIGRAGHRR